MSSANKLADILSRSKAVMQKTDENHGTTIRNTQSNNSFSGEEKEMPKLILLYSCVNRLKEMTLYSTNSIYSNDLA